MRIWDDAFPHKFYYTYYVSQCQRQVMRSDVYVYVIRTAIRSSQIHTAATHTHTHTQTQHWGLSFCETKQLAKCIEISLGAFRVLRYTIRIRCRAAAADTTWIILYCIWFCRQTKFISRKILVLSSNLNGFLFGSVARQCAHCTLTHSRHGIAERTGYVTTTPIY